MQYSRMYAASGVGHDVADAHSVAGSGAAVVEPSKRPSFDSRRARHSSPARVASLTSVRECHGAGNLPPVASNRPRACHRSGANPEAIPCTQSNYVGESRAH